MIRYRYNTQVQPPAQFVHLRLRNPADGLELLGVPAQIDTAADRTVLSQGLVHDLALQPVEVVANSAEGWPLLGRDLLKTVRLTLDGPRSALEIG